MATIAGSLVGTDTWNADVYDMMSIASRLAAAVKDHRAVLQLAVYFWRINKRLNRLFETVYSSMEKAEKGLLASVPVDPEAISRGMASLNQLHNVLDYLYTASIKTRLNNHSVVAAGVAQLHRNDERIVELIEWFNDVMSPQALEDIFANAKAQLDRGETVTLAN